MISIALIVFWGALISIVLFFVFKVIGRKRGTVCCAALRQKADAVALYIEAELLKIMRRIEHIPTFGYIATKTTHVFASLIASFAGFVEKKAHLLADWAARRDIDAHAQTKSDFLRKVGEHKNNL